MVAGMAVLLMLVPVGVVWAVPPVEETWYVEETWFFEDCGDFEVWEDYSAEVRSDYH